MNWTWFGPCCSVETLKTEPSARVGVEPPSPERKRRIHAVSDDGTAKAPLSSAGDKESKSRSGDGEEPVIFSPSNVNTDEMDSHQAIKANTSDNDHAGADADTVSVCSSVKSTARSACSTSSLTSEYIKGRIPARQREAERIQKEMKKFVRTMVRGTPMGVLSPDGQMRTCTCSLDKKMKYFVLELKRASRKIALSSITEVYQGKEPEDIDTPLDDLCSTLTLDHGEAITFHFKDVPSRENFAMCLQLLVDGQH